MPYIKLEDRKMYDEAIEQLGRELDGVAVFDEPGHLNYIIFALVRRMLQMEPIGYARLNAIIGALECCKAEIYRRIVAPYEDEKIDQNGDVVGG